ncbi:MAG: hypothetical protein V1917_03975 [Candidatus Gottesmanbacteria bacterium]
MTKEQSIPLETDVLSSANSHCVIFDILRHGGGYVHGRFFHNPNTLVCMNGSISTSHQNGCPQPSCLLYKTGELQVIPAQEPPKKPIDLSGVDF